MVRCTVKWNDMLKTLLLILEEVQMTAEEDMKRVLSYVVYMALDCRTVSGVWRSKITLKN